MVTTKIEFFIDTLSKEKVVFRIDGNNVMIRVSGRDDLVVPIDSIVHLAALLQDARNIG
jgi:hypothetical protein